MFFGREDSLRANAPRPAFGLALAVVGLLSLSGCATVDADEEAAPAEDVGAAELATTATSINVLCHESAYVCEYIPSLVPGATVTYWDAWTWGSATIADFSAFDVVYIHDLADFYPEIAAVKDAYAAAVNGRVAITGIHFEKCDGNPLAKACKSLSNFVSWAANGSGLGLVVSSQYIDGSWLPTTPPYSTIAYAGLNGNYDRAMVVDPGHAVAQTTTDALLSNFFSTSHNYFTGAGAFTNVANICKYGGYTYPYSCPYNDYAPLALVASLDIPDQDGDGLPDPSDNCPTVGNIDQNDLNLNDVGDACESAPSVTVTPSTTVATPGAPITFTATASDPDNAASSLTYEWRVNGVVQPGATASTFTTTLADATCSNVRVIVRDPGNLNGFDDAGISSVSATGTPLAGEDALACLVPGEVAPVQLDGSACSGAQFDGLTYTWSEGGTVIATGASPTVWLGAGTHTIDLVVTDGQQASATDQVVITLAGDTAAPSITLLGADPLTIGCGGYTDPGATAQDGCSGDLTSSITTSGSVVTSTPGTYTIVYSVSDDAGNTASSERTVIVENGAEEPQVTGAELTLWPPNHKYRTYELSQCITSVTGGCGGAIDISSAEIVSIYSDEPDKTPGGGATNDIVIVDSDTFKLRAERKNGGNGRVYGVEFVVTDASGNTVTGTCYVGVPHDNSGGAAIDDGPAQTVTAP